MGTLYGPRKISLGHGNKDDETFIPCTAIPVKITNIIDPYHLRIYETESYVRNLDKLAAKLHQLTKNVLAKYRDDLRPKIGDMVIVDNRSSFDMELPAWCCRGVVGSVEMDNGKCNVFLPDHGLALNLWVKKLMILPPSSITDDFLTMAVGIDNVLPIARVNGVTRITKTWSEEAIQFTREMVAASKSTHFERRVHDKFGNEYGELYLILDGEIVAMSEALVYNRFATTVSSRKAGRENSKSGTESHDDQLSSKESKTITNTSDDSGRFNRTTAVYPRAFNGLFKKNRRIDYDYEILVCGETRFKQLKTVAEGVFPEKIHKVLRSMSFSRPMRLQGYVWPAVTNGLNVVAVNSPKSGKTFSYLVPIVSLIATNEIYPKIPGVNGPLALILCESSLDVYRVHEHCVNLLKEYSSIKIIAAYSGIQEKSLTASIYNGCEILITVAPYLKRLINRNKDLLNFERLSHVIFDGADVIFDKYRKSLGVILKILDKVRNERRESSGLMPLQTITIARHWTSYIGKLVTAFMDNPYICIGSYMEAAVYAAIKPEFIFLSSDQKAAKIVEILGVRWSMFKTVVMCSTTEEAKKLDEFLRSRSIDTLVAHGEMISTKLHGLRESWMARVSGRYSVLICTDQVLSDVNIKDADWLIHYSLASSTKTRFYYRFSTLTRNFSLRVQYKEKPKIRLVLIIDESDDTRLSSIVTMLRRLDVKIPPPLEAFFEKIILSVEMTKTDHRFCENLKAFGRCSNREACGSRHCVIPEIDRPSTAMQTGDYAKFVITSVHAANHYSARIVEYTRADTDERVTLSFQELADLVVEMQRHFSDPARRRSAKTVSIGNICAVENPPGNFKRCQVLSATGTEVSDMHRDVEIRCIDDGDIVSVKACQLLEVPDDLSRRRAHVVDIYLTGVAPIDDEPTWSPCADKVAFDWLTENTSSQTSSVYGKVLLHLGHVIWVDPLEVRYKLAGGYPDLVDASLKATLIDSQCAMKNEAHIENLIELWRAAVPDDVAPDAI